MSKNFEILSSESVEKLRNVVKYSKDFQIEEFERLVSKYDLKLISSSYNVVSDTNLLMPDSTDWDSNNDKPNSILLFNSIPNLTADLSTDERLWTTLAFGLWSNYSKARWLKDENDSKSIVNHWFAPTARSRWRDHSISRLWYVGNFSHSIPSLTAAQVLDVLYWNSELINSFLGRPRTTSSRKISGIVLRLLYEEVSSLPKKAFKREEFRDFMKEIDLQGGKRDLDLIPSADLENLISKIFEEKYIS